MAVTIDLTCLYSTVKNISGVTAFFPFLLPHGVELAADEEYTVFGDIREAIHRSNDRFGYRDQNGLENALEVDWLEIRNTPAPILTDTVTDDLKMLSLASGSLTVLDPCFEGSVTT